MTLSESRLSPSVPWKASRITSTFSKVAPNAGKIEIKKAVEEIFGVKVAKVNTIKLPGKWKRMGVYRGKRPDIKKAVVTLTADSKKIEIFENHDVTRITL